MPPAVPPTVTSEAAKPATGSLNVAVKLISSSLVGSACPAALVTVTLGATLSGASATVCVIHLVLDPLDADLASLVVSFAVKSFADDVGPPVLFCRSYRSVAFGVPVVLFDRVSDQLNTRLDLDSYIELARER